MNRDKIIFFAALLGSAALAGCAKETTSSANIKTGGIAALIDVTAGSSSSSKVHVELRVGGSSSNTYVVLDNGDKLIAEVGGEKKDMQSQDDGIYEVDFPTAAADTEFKVTLERPNDTTASNNRGSMPKPFSITAPSGGKTVSRGTEDLKVTWDPSGDSGSMTIDLSGSCIFDKSYDVPGDSGSFTIAKKDLDSTNDKKPESCDVTMTMTRSRNGTADTAFDSESWFKLHQVRTASFTSTP